MHIDAFEDAIMNCRFCFMCRHLSAIGNVRCTEVDTPRVRAAMLYGLRTGTNSFDDEDFIDALYRCELSACCRRNCVNGVVTPTGCTRASGPQRRAATWKPTPTMPVTMPMIQRG